MAHVTVLLPQGFADWEYALLAGTGGPFFGLDIRFVSPTPGEVTSQGGLTAHVPAGPDSLASSPGVIAVIGSPLWATDAAPDLSDLLRAHYHDGGVVAGICGGTLALARAGLLDHHQHTSNDLQFLIENAKTYAGQTSFKPSKKAVADKRIITSPGTAPVSFTAEIFALAGVRPASVTQFKSMMAAEHD